MAEEENDFSANELISMMSIVYAQASDSTEDWILIEKPHTWMQYIKSLLRTLTTISPTWLHFNMAVKVLTQSEEKIEPDSKLIELLAKKFIEACKDLNRRIRYPKALAHLFTVDNTSQSKFEIVRINDEECDKEFLGNGLFIWDTAYLDTLKSLGQKGKEVAEWLEKDPSQLSGHFKKYHEKKEVEHLKGFWFKKDPDEPFYSRALLILCECVWMDIVKALWKKQTEGHPSLAKTVIDKMISFSSPYKNKKFIEKDGSIICYDKSDDQIFTAPAIDKNMIALFMEGVKGLCSLTGHKMLRWQVNAGFDRWASGEKDPRLIKIDGGYSRIAELIKCANKRDIATVREILHVQAHGCFRFPDGSHGNMITLRIEERHKNQEPSKIHIVLGDMLLPEYVCQFKRSDRLLVPIGDLPPLHGSPNSHASQAQLQLLVFKEFSNQSDRLAREGSVLITQEQWKRLAYESGLSPDKVDIVIAHWYQSDLFNCFLERQGDEYRLGSYYNRTQNFLEDQGKRRIANSERGKKSVEQRIKRAKT